MPRLGNYLLHDLQQNADRAGKIAELSQTLLDYHVKEHHPPWLTAINHAARNFATGRDANYSQNFVDAILKNYYQIAPIIDTDQNLNLDQLWAWTKGTCRS